MTFLHATLAAAGLACIAIPIIIHLLMHRRRKPVMWGAMRFLLEAYRRQRRRLMLEKWLLLACRCLVIALLALAIGRPLLGRILGPGAGRTLYIVIDNSLTSTLRAPDGRSALERHKSAAKAAIDAFRAARIGPGVAAEGDRIALITLGSPADPLVVPPSADSAAVSRIIDELAPTDSRADLPGALQLIADAFSASPDGQSAAQTATARAADAKRTFVAIFSEFREGSLELAPGASGGASLPRLPEGLTILASQPASESRTNIFIAAVEPLRSVIVGASPAAASAGGGDNLVRILLRRSGADLPPATTTVRVRIATPAPIAQPPAPTQASVRWAQGQDSAMLVAALPQHQGPSSGASPSSPAPVAATSLSAAGGAIIVTLDDDALLADNRWRRPVEFRDSLRVGIIAPTRFTAGAAPGGGADKLDPGTWARYALSPGDDASRQAGGIDIIDIEPASIDAARLAGLDAVVLPRPDLIQDSGWARLGLFAAAGGVVLVTPPPGINVHLWPDAMIKGLRLPDDWTIAREAITAENARLAPAPAAALSSSDATAPAASGLLALVEGELDSLLRPVNLRTVLPLESHADVGQPILRLDSGPLVMWAGRPRPDGTDAAAAPRGLIVYLGIALSLDWGDLPAKPLMVPLMQEVVRQGIGQARGSMYAIAGGSPGSRPPAPAGAIELRAIDDRDPGPSGASAQPDAPRASQTLSLAHAEAAALRQAGLFAALDDRGSTRALLAINPDPRASRTLTQPQESVGRLLAATAGGGSADSPAGGTTDAREVVWLPDEPSLPAAAAGASDPGVRAAIASLLGSADSGSPISLPLLIAALVLAIIEVGLARWASHAEVLPPAVRQAAGIVTGGLTTKEGAAA